MSDNPPNTTASSTTASNTTVSNTTMRAAVYRRPGVVEVAEVPVPPPADGGALVEVDYCGVCGTDLHLVLDGWGRPDSILGHEWSGRIVDPGSSDLTVGSPVVGAPPPPCGRCHPCGLGRPSLCRDRSAAGAGPDQGAFAGYVRLDPRRLVPVPPGVDQRAAAYVEPLAVALHAVNLAPLDAGQRALVFGAGPIGAAVVALLVRQGVEVDVIEPGDLRRDLAGRLGARVRDVDDLDVPGHPGHVADGAVNTVFETSGARAATETGLTQVMEGGTLMIVGTGMDFPRLDTNRVILNELHVTGAYEYDAGGFDAALELLAGGELPLDELLEPSAVGLDGLLDAMMQLRAGELAGKVLVRP